MSQMMKTWIPISIIAFALSVAAFGQAIPTATEAITPTPAGTTGPRLSWVDGTVHYALTLSQIVQLGYFGSGNTTTSTAVSGNVGYVSLSQWHPTSVLFSGGVLFGQSGQGVSTFQNLTLSQSLIRGLWLMNVGVTGVPGIVDIGGGTLDGPASGPAGGVLTYSGNRISNTLSGSLERRLTARTSASGGGSWAILHFLDDRAGLDTSAITGQVGLNYRINVRNSASISAVYSSYDTTGVFAVLPPGYPNNNVTFVAKGINVSYSRQWTRALSSDVSVGPQWIQSSSAQLIPDRLDVYVNAGLGYGRRLTSYSLRYTHGVNGGSGVQPGAISDNIGASASRNFTRVWAGSASFGWTRTSGLLNLYPALGPAINGATTTEYGTLQVSRGFTRTISGYASYSIQNQSVNKVLSTQNAFNGTSHTFAVGVSWTPQAKRLGEF
jgi:hypothetical protein